MMPTSCGGAINFFFQGRTQQDQTVTVSVVNPSPPLVGCTDSASIVTKSRKIRVYLTSEQKALVKVWLAGSRWWYNEAVSLYRAGFSVSEYEMRAIVRAVSPEWFADVPSKILCGAIADAHKANQAVWRKRAGRLGEQKHPIAI